MALTPQSPFTNQSPYFPTANNVFNTTNFVEKLTLARLPLSGAGPLGDRRPFGVRRRGPIWDKRGRAPDGKTLPSL